MAPKISWYNLCVTFGALLLFLVGSIANAADAKPALAPSEIVAAAPKADWVAIAPSDLLVMDLASGKRVVIQLMPPPFSQGWVYNIRKLAAARFWDGTSINRVQDNYVVQWGDAHAEDKAKAKVSPSGLVNVPQTNYTLKQDEAVRLAFRNIGMPYGAKALKGLSAAVEKSQMEKERAIAKAFPSDAYAAETAGYRGWPMARSDQFENNYWPVHCYGMVGVGRGMPPDTGTGAELYTVIGHAPRHLDRNIALVGRVIAGIEHLSSLPRGTGALGFYEKAEERTGITSIRIGSEVKDLPRFEYLSTESASFATYADARANRRDPFFIQPAGGADICNIPVPVRVAPGEPTRK
jgi:peptidylprolyl isomerase